MTITKQQFLNMVTDLVAGIYANPQSGNLMIDSYGRQQVIQAVWNDLQAALGSVGCGIEDD